MNSGKLLSMLAAILLIPVGESVSQQTALPWSAFGSGFAGSAAGNVKAKSSIGETFVGSMAAGGVRSDAGFLANPLFRGPATVVTVTLQAGWNMIAVPAHAPDPRKATLFPDAISNAFKFENGYFAVDSLRVGRGYWLKFPGPQTVGVGGAPAVLETVSVAQGWNLIGGIASPVVDSAVGSIPPGIVVSNFFKFDNPAGYSASETIDPGRAYWVKANQAGSLVFSSGPVMPGRVAIRPTDELPPPPPGEELEPSAAAPQRYQLNQAFPNPFNPSTTISYAIPGPAYVRLEVFDALGRLVATPVDGERTAGEHSVVWNAAGMPSGVYFYRIQAGGFTQTKRLMLVR